jgi:hypothetical protein
MAACAKRALGKLAMPASTKSENRDAAIWYALQAHTTKSVNDHREDKPIKAVSSASPSGERPLGPATRGRSAATSGPGECLDRSQFSGLFLDWMIPVFAAVLLVASGISCSLALHQRLGFPMFGSSCDPDEVTLAGGTTHYVSRATVYDKAMPPWPTRPPTLPGREFRQFQSGTKSSWQASAPTLSRHAREREDCVCDGIRSV